MRDLTKSERQNVRALTAAGLDVTFLLPTRTGLTKSILDAIAPFRNRLKKWGVHDYSVQRQGDPGRVELPAVLLSPSSSRATTVSLYRPVTKGGDPRIWFTGLPSIVSPDEMLGIFPHRGQLHVINLSRTAL